MAGLTFLSPNITYTTCIRRPRRRTTVLRRVKRQGAVANTKSVTVTVGSTPPPTAQPPVIVIRWRQQPDDDGAQRTAELLRFQQPVEATTRWFYNLVALYGSAEVVAPTTAMPTVVLGATPGPYYFNLTVGDSKGMTTHAGNPPSFTSALKLRLGVVRTRGGSGKSGPPLLLGGEAHHAVPARLVRVRWGKYRELKEICYRAQDVKKGPCQSTCFWVFITFRDLKLLVGRLILAAAVLSQAAFVIKKAC